MPRSEPRSRSHPERRPETRARRIEQYGAMLSERGFVGRREDEALLLGKATFIDGLRTAELAGAYHAAFARSIEPHARIVAIDVVEARGLPGVVAVYTAADLDIWPLPPRLPIMNKNMWRPMLASGVVRFVSEPLAGVLPEVRPGANRSAHSL